MAAKNKKKTVWGLTALPQWAAASGYGAQEAKEKSFAKLGKAFFFFLCLLAAPLQASQLQTSQQSDKDKSDEKEKGDELGITSVLLVNNPQRIQELARQARQDEQLMHQLWDLVEQSKSTNSKLAATGAANALTILNAAGVSFSGKDLRDINAPGAVLDGAVMDGADLRRANLARAWLGHASLSQARLDQAQLGGAYFGERAFFGHTSVVMSASFSGDGTRVASGSYDKTVRVWDVETGQQLQIFKGHTSNVNSVSFSRDGTRVASGSDDNTVRVWDVKTNQQLQIFKGHTNRVWGVSFSGDGTRVASSSGSYGGNDNTVRVWDVKTGQQLQIFKGHTG
ncbi:MAG: pentapeptide repeat-containing protein, partial [Myxococcota bacterium]